MSHILVSKTQMEGGLEFTCAALEEMCVPYEYTPGKQIQMIGWNDTKTHKADLVIRKAEQPKFGFELVSDLGFKVDKAGKVSSLCDEFAAQNPKRFQEFMAEVGQRHNAQRAIPQIRQKGFIVRDSKMVDGHLKVRMEKATLGR